MQSWGDGSRFQLRRTADAPTKSGVLGLILCAGGIDRRDAAVALVALRQLRFGVRIDRAGVRGWDYHTAGAGFGIMSAEGRVKKTQGTNEPETLLSRREYLFDASFVAGLEGPTELVARIESWLADPVWPVFLGRKCCVPALPVLERVVNGASLAEALVLPPCRAGTEQGGGSDLRVLMDAPVGAPLPEDARVVHDEPRAFGVMDHAQRWVIETTLTPRPPAFSSSDFDDFDSAACSEESWWRRIRRERLEHDHGLCVFCKAEAEEVHHVTYERRGAESLDDLRSLCGDCHDACTALEYGTGMGVYRVDPTAPEWRDPILRQIAIARSAGASAVRARVFESMALAQASAARDAQRGDD